ncbi:MAG: type II toxin-antitoxin system Phd/YefM family antitoxin [Candidatus Velthaea sp.]
MAHEWQVQEAKADLSALIRAAEDDGPQTITRNGKAVAVVISLATFHQLKIAEKTRRGSLLSFLKTWPPLELTRDKTDVGREIEF